MNWGKRVHSAPFATICFIALVFILSIPLIACAESSAPPKAVFIIVDGIPPDVLEMVDTPVLDAISAVGGYAHAYVGGQPGGPTESPTISAVGYNSLLTGTWANKHNVWGNDIKAPNYAYWDIFRIAKNHDPELQTAIFSTWLDNRTKLMDVQVGRVWDAIRKREAETGEDWLIVVTTDHGRDTETGKGHGGQTDRERATWIVTNSTNLNDHFDDTPGVVDILPSIVTHMGLSIPAAIEEQLDGISFIDDQAE